MEGRRDKDKQFSERWFNWQHVTNIPTDFFPCRAHHPVRFPGVSHTRPDARLPGAGSAGLRFTRDADRQPSYTCF